MKQINVGDCIEELLYSRDSVIIPGLGGFASSYQQAGIDHVQGLLNPPSKELNFNDNLSMNDGVLTHFIQEKYQISQTEAGLAITEFVEKTKKALDNREIVVFPKIGRLYLDFEQQFKFLQDNTNFNADSFGLPIVQFYPVVRYQKTAAREIRTTAVTESLRNSMRGNSGVISTLFQRFMPWIIVLSIIVIALSIYFINREPQIEEAYREEVPADRVNISPERLPAEEETIIVDEPEVPEEEVVEIPDPPSQPEEAEESNPTPPARVDRRPKIDTEAPTLDPGVDSGVIIIGAFRETKNAEKLIQKVYEAGYDAYSDRKGKSTRVGVRIIYGDQAELDRQLKTIQDLFNDSAWVLD